MDCSLVFSYTTDYFHAFRVISGDIKLQTYKNAHSVLKQLSLNEQNNSWNKRRKTDFDIKQSGLHYNSLLAPSWSVNWN